MMENENTHLDKLIIESVIEQLTTFDKRLQALETGRPRSTPVAAQATPNLIQIRNEISTLKTTLEHVNERAANMRLDRQGKQAVKRLFKLKEKPNAVKESPVEIKRKKETLKVQREMTVKADVLIISPSYPGGMRDYGGEFVQKRAEAYLKARMRPAVLEVSANKKVLERNTINGVDVVRINPAGLAKVLRLSKFKTIAVHSIEKQVWTALKPIAETTPVTVFVHGFEARDWKLLEFNFNKEQLKTLRPRLDNANAERRQTMSEVFKHKNVNVVFVSEYMKAIAEDFASVKATKSHVIHNSISHTDFPYRAKTAEDRKKVLWVRSFAAKNYSNDISRDVILGLSKKTYFKELKFTIFGNGALFEEITAPLRKFENVKIEQRFISPAELATLHATHGVMLVPTRWDSQGLTCGEAMSSGLVPLASGVAAINDFADDSCAILAPLNDASKLIEGYDSLYHNPKEYLKMSAAAAKRSQAQCGFKQTLSKEIILIKTYI